MSADSTIDLDAGRKHWATISARLALKGFQAWRTDPDDGVQRFFVGRWGIVRAFANVEDLERFAEQAGASA